MKSVCLSMLIVSATHLCVDAVYGGGFYPITEVPYQAQLNIKTLDSFYYCGATILSEYWLISAAHCVAKNTTLNVTVRLGTSTTTDKGIIINVTDIVVHDQYKTKPMAFDVSLLKAEQKMEFNEYSYPIPISRVSPKPGDIVTVSGYGYSHFRMFGQALKIKNFRVIEDDVCRRNLTVDATQFCADVKEADLCFGDSGGPAVLDGKLVGVASQGCEYSAPVVFVKVSELYDWILEKTGIKYDWRKRRAADKVARSKNSAAKKPKRLG